MRSASPLEDATRLRNALSIALAKTQRDCPQHGSIFRNLRQMHARKISLLYTELLPTDGRNDLASRDDARLDTLLAGGLGRINGRGSGDGPVESRRVVTAFLDDRHGLENFGRNVKEHVSLR